MLIPQAKVCSEPRQTIVGQFPQRKLAPSLNPNPNTNPNPNPNRWGEFFSTAIVRTPCQTFKWNSLQ